MIKPEEWKPAPGADGYEVSSLGRVMSYRKGSPQLMRGQVINDYRRVTLRMSDGSRKSVAVHRMVALAFLGPCPEGEEVRHLNGNPQDNALSNLRFGTHSANIRDAVEHGTHGQASKTHCVRGHEFTPKNTWRSDGVRHCRECRAANNRQYKIRAALRAANVQMIEVAA